MAPASYFFVLFLLSHPLLLHSAQEEEEKQSVDTDCPHFYCGNLDNIPEHGWLTVDNCTELIQKIQLKSGGEWYDVVLISPAANIRIHNHSWLLDYFRDSCVCKSSENFLSPNISFNTTLFNLTQSKCYGTPQTYFSYISSGACSWYSNSHPHIRPPFPLPQCSTIQPKISITHINDHLFSLPAADIFFEVQVTQLCYKCYYKGSQCFIDSEGNFQCDKGNNKQGLKTGLGITVASAVGIGVLMFIFCCFKRKYSSNNSMVFWRKETLNHQNVEVILRNYGSISPKIYSYPDVKKMTYSFRDKLGQGGYGGVYKGKLSDGRLVAVKVLNKSRGDGEEFVNEVVSIGRTSHVNIVTLLGFCFEGSKRALIYEFMPNGSLEKFIYENPSRGNRQLGWEALYQIAIGIARGLEYLHRGCNTRILHFDIKPHNILLDEDFCPKISDFGLAKLCPKNESITSMLGARGTAGYIAPEVFCRNIGRVSHKSDVYSYGMMVLEMVGGRKNFDVGVDHTSQIYFPHWIYERLEQGDQLGLHGIMNEEENEKARKMILVSLWCIQTDPSKRPAMGTVVDMFQGSLGSLQNPPRPFMSSPSRSEADSSTTPTLTS